MVDGKGRPNGDGSSRAGQHEEFLELCALSTSGSLSEEEQKRLREHLATCAECREAMKQYERVVDCGIPALAPELAEKFPEEDSSFSQEDAEKSFFKRLSEEKERARLGETEPWLSPLAVRRSRNFRRSLDRYRLWLPMAAAVLLCTALGLLTYRMGKGRGIEVALSEQKNLPSAPTNYQKAAGVASQNADASEAQLSERDKAIAELRGEIARQSAEVERLKALQSEQQNSLQASQEENKQLAEERDRLSEQVLTGQAVLEASEKRLNALERERSEDAVHSASLEKQVAELSRTVNDQGRTTEEQQDLLAKDRDIRELVGARDLYITEVYDVARTGETQKPFGRVFYTKGKSLIFYAYDLNDSPGVKEASTFQAWGRRGPDRNQAFNLGMFFEDSVAKKRWVLKFNDKKALDQIDAVFVTVEPHGGSERPTGRPLLFAYLKVTPNHP